MIDLYFIIIQNLLKILSAHMKNMKILFYFAIVFFFLYDFNLLPTYLYLTFESIFKQIMSLIINQLLTQKK